MMEGNTILAALAARTSTINLGLLVGGVTYRNPALVAKLTTTIDIISGGRAVLGIGAAWFEEEHKAYGFDFPPLKERFERLEDALNIARHAVHAGRRRPTRASTTASTSAFNNPKPIRGDIPILIGGSGERKTLRMVAQYADGSNLFGDVERVKHLLGVLEGHCETLGRDPGEITKTRMGRVYIGATHEAAEAKFAPVLERAPDTGPRAGGGVHRRAGGDRRAGAGVPRRGPGRHHVLDAGRPRPRVASRSPARRSSAVIGTKTV